MELPEMRRAESKRGEVMTGAPDIVEPRYLLQKRGLYYRPMGYGYTGIKDRAGRFFAHDAFPPDVVAIHEDEAADFSPSCCNELARQHLRERVTSLREKLGVACEAFQKIAAPLNCGCNPCTSSCRSGVALQYEIEARQDIAIAALDLIKEATP